MSAILSGKSKPDQLSKKATEKKIFDTKIDKVKAKGSDSSKNSAFNEKQSSVDEQDKDHDESEISSHSSYWFSSDIASDPEKKSNNNDNSVESAQSRKARRKSTMKNIIDKS